MYHAAMFRLTERRFVRYFKDQPETGMGYWIATAHLKDGRIFKQVLVESGDVTKVRGSPGVPFDEADVDRFVVSHHKWNE